MSPLAPESPWIVSLGMVLVHFVWEGVLIGALAWLGLGFIRSASSRYGFLCAMMLLCAAAPLLTWWLLVASPQRSVAAMTASSPAASGKPAQAPRSAAGVAGKLVVVEFRTAPQNPPGDAIVPDQAALLVDEVSPWLARFWLGGVALLLVRRGGDWAGVRRLCRSGLVPADRRWAERLQELAARLGVDRAVRLLESARVEVPTLVGWSRPVLIVPLSFFAGLAPAQVDAIFAHELAHVRRHDYLVNLAQVLIETLLFYHPIVWWLGRAIRDERENCCDDLALRIVPDQQGYVETLALLEERRTAPAAFALAVSGGSLLKRARRLLVPATTETGNRYIIAALIVLIALSGAWLGEAVIRNARADARLFARLEEGTGWEKSDFKHEVDRDRFRLNHAFDAQGLSLLDLAAKRGLPDDALLMLLAGANPNLVDAAGRTPIYYALHEPDQRQDMVRDLLILRGARLDVVDPNGVSPLMEAVSQGNDKTALALLRFGADPHPPGAQGAKLIALAKRRGFLFAQSLQACTPGLTRDELARVPANPAVQARFVEASRRGDLDAMTVLLRQGAKPDDVSAGLPAVSAAVINYQPDAVIYLLHLGADANVVNEENVPPLTYTFGWLGQESDYMQEALIACGARFDILPHHDESLLTVACGRENEHAIQWLIWIGADPAAPTPGGTPMYLASKEGQDRSVKLLQRNGVTEAPFNDPDPKWQMTHAAKSDNLARIRQLLGQGVAVDLPLNGSNDSALMIAIAYRSLHVARYLLAHGANPNYQNSGGDNPLRVSVGWHYDDMEKFREELLDAGANPNLRAHGGETPFIAACRNGDLAPKITQLLAHGANINQVDSEGHTPLYYAERSGRTDAAAYLRQRGALDGVPPPQ